MHSVAEWQSICFWRRNAQARRRRRIDLPACDRDAVLAYMQSAGFEVYEMLGGGKAHRITDLREPAQGETKFLLLHGGLRVGGME